MAVSVVAIAARDLNTRRLEVCPASSAVAFKACSGIALAGAALVVISAQPVVPLESSQIGPYLETMGYGILGYYAIVTAMRIGEASALTPFQCTRLVSRRIIHEPHDISYRLLTPGKLGKTELLSVIAKNV